MKVTDVIYYQSTLMVDSTDGATFNKRDSARVGISYSVSVENKLFVLIVKILNKLAQIK